MRRSKEDAEETRCAILTAAEWLFLEQGVAHTSLEQVARRAGVTRGAIYWHFQNKAHLFHEMLNQVRLPLEPLAEQLAAANGLTSLQVLRELCIEAMTSLSQDEQRRRIFTILLRRCEFTKDLREAEERHEAFINQFIALCERQFAQPTVRAQLRSDITPRLAARSLHILIVGLFNDWLRDPALFDPQTDTPVMVDSCFRGLLRQWP
ncbi:MULTISPECIES: TetR family transcriptional regulator [Pseudomonas aeruginosa group]|uniref:TetR family transcriptional regulator n=1 Tax=Pseudomonas nitroreducens TaxID=46680 RepID=A0A6G6ISN2_PSENT|nr:MULTISPECIES: TetR family transcriptional regulator [Pseudomonas aeruginosa group]KYO75085.1 HTH-type transcriptional repressor BepR [Pseudomonas aeruginosa]QIE85977.1 TetR family transcriptional regulator [Pseudomonas nitroreducens]HCE6396375.1 TetR family transcriptional regulator [Pseudomonas aeruginosa]